MSRAKNIRNHFHHCTAGFAKVPAIEEFWARPKSRGGLGWKGKGYNYIVDLDGTTYWLRRKANGELYYSLEYNEETWEIVVNGVLGFNDSSVSGSYIGGVQNIGTKEKPKWIGVDTRTEHQKTSMFKATTNWIEWMNKNGGDLSKSLICGHRDASVDKNGNGKIESWERIKECPCYDVIPEYRWLLQTSVNLANGLPKK